MAWSTRLGTVAMACWGTATRRSSPPQRPSRRCGELHCRGDSDEPCGGGERLQLHGTSEEGWLGRTRR
eukprot:3841786-Prymnesium_polylepis.1